MSRAWSSSWKFLDGKTSLADLDGRTSRAEVEAENWEVALLRERPAGPYVPPDLNIDDLTAQPPKTVFDTARRVRHRPHQRQ